MKLIDIHTHLDHERFKPDLDKVIERARNAGVTIITSGVNSRTNRLILDIQKKYPEIKVSFGIYPLDALAEELKAGEAAGFARDVEEFDLDKELEWIEENKDKCVAIGECGLDYNYITNKKEEQKEVLDKIIKLVEKIDKPIILHTRKAESDVLDIMEKSKLKKVILHCFSGRKTLIKRGIDLGYYFSIPPVITRLQHFQTLVSMVPIEQLLTETDAPYLSPVAGERNEPSNVQVTIKEIAKIKNLPEEKVAEIIFNNAKKLFDLK
jgi:TatD DNase family protein